MNSIALADYLKKTGVVRSPLVYEAFKAIDRKEFVPKKHQDYVYSDQPLAIGYDQTISQPYTVAFMLDLLEVRSGQKILDVGSGSGWTTALLAHIVGKTGTVAGVELVPELVKMGQKNLAKFALPWAQIRQAEPVTYGLPAVAPFDRILVSAEANEVPSEILEQLATPGILVIPVDGAIVKVAKSEDGKLSQDRYEGFAFVPLIKR